MRTNWQNCTTPSPGLRRAAPQAGRGNIAATFLCRTLTFLLILFSATSPALALDGNVAIHDPSTVIRCGDHFYVFGTGRGITVLSSSDGFTWKRQGRVFDRIPAEVKALAPKNDGTLVWAPDVTYLNGKYYLYYAVSAWDSFDSAVALMTNPTLDPASRNYKWTDGGPVVHSTSTQNMNDIDPGVLQAPDGTMWLTYGSYHGTIQLVQLDPKTGNRLSPNSPVWNVASRSEASDVIFHDGYYYLFVNHGSCCQGKRSTYNIRVGRSAKVTGPYLDRHGEDLANGAGTLFLAANGTRIGPGHFGRIIDDGVEKFSCHYESDVSKGARPVLDIRPLLWTTDGWPLPGENLKAGTYQAISKQTGTILQANPAATAAEMGEYLSHDNQQWSIAPGGGGMYKIASAATQRALEASDKTLQLAAPATSDAQLWKIDELTDGTYRIKSKQGGLCLTAVSGRRGEASIALEEFTGADAQCWTLNEP